jgi:alpha-N-arabinofuranosidase
MLKEISMKRQAFLLSVVVVMLLPVIAQTSSSEISLTLHPDDVVGRIDEKIYGHFLEHIYHSCNGGLWGELVWNRSFEQNELGFWTIRDSQISQEGMGTNVRLTFGDVNWRDYEYTLEAKKKGGQEGFLILFRVKNEKEFYWCNLGGWGNERHGLERGLESQNRWGPVGPQPSGHISTDKWYRIKVRCQGRHLQVWLDETLIIDFTDDQRAVLTGKVGIGTWATQAVFRNLKVKALDGSVLYEGLPDILNKPNPARYWSAYGGAKVFLDRVDPLNSSVCQKIVTDSQGGGIQQTGLCIRPQHTYEGSIWAKGSAVGGLVVQLRDERGRQVTNAIDAPSPAWREYSFRLTPEWDCDNARLCVGVKGKGEVWIDQVSMMPKDWKERGGFRSDLLGAIAALRPPVIRWPGGCFASSYQWKQGIGPQHKRLPHQREIWDDLDVYSFGTDEFIEMCRRVGAEPLIVVNVGFRQWNNNTDIHDYTRDVLDWIEYCNGPADSQWGKVRAANGHLEPYNVTYWEIDNETWHTPAEAYAERVLELAPLMKKIDPSIKLIACGSGGMGRRNRNGMEYNRIVIQRCAHVLDYLSIHHYENPDRFARGPRDYEAFFREIGNLIKGSKNPNLKIYVSEWNAQSTDWRTGLYCGGLLNVFERCSDILEMAGPALFLRHVSATAWDNAFINFDNRTWFPAPNYVVMKLWREHYAPNRINITGETNGINIVGTKSGDGKSLCVKCVNPSDESQKIQLAIDEGFEPTSADMIFVAPGSLESRNTLEKPMQVTTDRAALKVMNRNINVTLPALSAVVVTIRGDRIRTYGLLLPKQAL